MKAIYDSQDAIPEALRSEYVEQGGKWVLNLEGDHPAFAAVVKDANTKVGEFRNNNLSLNGQLDEARKALDVYKALGMPADIQAQLAKVAELESKAKGSKTNEDVQAIIKAALEPVTQALELERTARTQAEAKATSQALEGTLTRAGITAGVNETALSDFLARGKGIFAHKDGQVIALKDGAPQYSSKRPGELLTVDEWASNLQAEAPHLYKPSTGGGEPGGNTLGNLPGAERVIRLDDMSKNLEDVASGKARVDMS